VTLIPEEIREHYSQIDESERLSPGIGELEGLRTDAILAEHLPPPPALNCFHLPERNTTEVLGSRCGAGLSQAA
jgi:hypothetical protein